MMAQIRHPNPNRLVVIAGLGGVRNELVASLHQENPKFLGSALYA